VLVKWLKTNADMGNGAVLFLFGVSC